MGIAERPKNTPANMSSQYKTNCTYKSAPFKIGQNISLFFIPEFLFFFVIIALFWAIYTLWPPFVYGRGSLTSKQSTTTRKQVATSSSSSNNSIIIFIVIIIWWRTSVVPRDIFILLNWCDHLNMKPKVFRTRLVKRP